MTEKAAEDTLPEPWSFELRLKKLRVQGFKSLRDVELSFEGKNPLVLVGTNGSGKTNIVELFLFLRRALHDEVKRRPYAPHAEWGTPQSLTWEASGAPIHVELVYSLRARREKGRDGNAEIREEVLKYSVVFALDDTLGTIVPLREEISLDKHGYTLSRLSELIDVRIRISNDVDKAKLTQVLNELGKEAGWESIACGEDMCRVTQKLEGKQTGQPPILSAPLFVMPIHRDEHLVAEVLLLPGSAAALVPIPRGLWPFTLTKILSLLNEWFGNILVLRQIDYGVAKWPHRRYNETMLTPRGENLAEVLHSLARQSRAWGRVRAALETLFPWLDVRIEFNQYGQIELVFYERRGDRLLRLMPSMVPDGVVKLLVIIAAAALEPSLLAIDEIENSLHARLIEYVMAELGDLEDPVIVATHSPIVVDIAGPERTLLLTRGPDGSTRVEKLAPKELSEKLVEEGIALSDYYIHAAT